jgi:ABC-type polysaccharide/polyol phosphate transport system ATPase subunit
MLLQKKLHEGGEQLEVLKDISFSAYPGDCVGLIGKNGAGKSTLLSLLAKVYKPTSGIARVNGRVAPLLQVGAGFHPDLTGLENVFFNGMMMGLSRDEIDAKLNDIVEFAGIPGFIDVPVRNYSSGMVSRLGFAVAVHVDAQVLIVDETLSVGDFKFVEKCEERIKAFVKNGGTIVFVTHAPAIVTDLANYCLWLEDGRIKMQGPPGEVVEAYSAS